MPSAAKANLFLICLTMAILPSLGCRSFRPLRAKSEKQIELVNPLPVPMVDRWLVMDQVSDELDNYFQIYREERIRQVNDVLTEGWIETHPKIGATILEPWHRDSTPGFERLHASLQTVRRFAKVRVIPTGNSYQIDVKVYKELEDLPEPKQSTVSGMVLRHDSTLDIDLPNQLLAPKYESANEGWIPMGRDFSLEQVILRNIQGRLCNITE